MTYIIDTVGKITLPDGTTCQGVILTSDDPADIRAAMRYWAGKVTLVPVPDAEPEDDEPEPLDAETVAQREESYKQSLIDAGRGHLIA